MMKTFLKETQPIFYCTLYSSFSQNKIPHAYLLCAKKGIDLHQAAMFMVKCLICDEDILACEMCNDCLRIENDNYVDFKRYDGKIENIKKRHIEEIQTAFAKSSMEGKAKIYLLENIDNATPEAMNSLLKMLEEPTEGIYAILTCENQNRVLPTIQSRTQIVNFHSISQQALAKQVIDGGMKEEDAKILSNIYDSIEKIKEVENTETYHNLKIEALNFVEDFFTKKDNLLINAQTHVFKNYNTKEDMQFFLDILLVLFKDVLYDSYGLPFNFTEHKDLLAICNQKINKDALIDVLEKILKTKEAIKSNANMMLLMDRFVYEL